LQELGRRRLAERVPRPAWRVPQLAKQVPQLAKQVPQLEERVPQLAELVPQQVTASQRALQQPLALPRWNRQLAPAGSKIWQIHREPEDATLPRAVGRLLPLHSEACWSLSIAVRRPYPSRRHHQRPVLVRSQVWEQ